MSKKEILFYLFIVAVVIGLLFLLSFSGITTRSIDSEWADNDCVEDWNCLNWTECIDGTSTRECIDSNSCSSNTVKKEYKAC